MSSTNPGSAEIDAIIQPHTANGVLKLDLTASLGGGDSDSGSGSGSNSTSSGGTNSTSASQTMGDTQCGDVRTVSVHEK
jgi:hypothetical protein